MLPYRPMRVRTGLTLIALAIVVAYLAYARTIEYPGRPVTFLRDSGTWPGVFHVHSVASDGTGTVDDIVRAAREAGASWVVVADHNTMPGHLYEYRDGVLVVFTPEVSGKDGHFTALGATRAFEKKERKGPAPLRLARAAGGVPVAAHPLARKRPYLNLDDPDLGGLEVLSADQEFRDVLRAPFRLVPSALAYAVNPAHAAARLVRRPDATLARWDQLLARRRMTGFCAVDAHGRPPYAVMMRLLQMYAVIGRAPSGDANVDGQALVNALVRGASFCGIDIFGSAGGFRFTAVTGAGEYPPGSDVALSDRPVLRVDLAYASAPGRMRPSVRCRGVDVPLSEVGMRAGHRFETSPMTPGPCRVEVSLGEDGEPARPWIVSNPIYIH
jgi:hypothetical protein